MKATQLDLLVARALNLEPVPGQPEGFFYYGVESGLFVPTTDQEQGGRIIDSQHIDTMYDGDSGLWSAKHPACRPKKRAWVHADTRLEAAMRAFMKYKQQGSK